MASNFRMRFQRNNGDLHIDLKGDFDGTSAHVLYDALKRNWDDGSKIFIHTNGLRRVHHFGQKVLHDNLSHLKGRSAHIVFTGDKGRSLAPEGM